MLNNGAKWYNFSPPRLHCPALDTLGMVVLKNGVSLATVGSGEYVVNADAESLVNGADRIVFARNRCGALHVVDYVVDRANAHDGAVLGAITLGA